MPVIESMCLNCKAQALQCQVSHTSFFRISSAARMEMSPYMLYLR